MIKKIRQYLYRKELDQFNRESMDDIIIYGEAHHIQIIRKCFNPLRYLICPIVYKRIPPEKIFINKREVKNESNN